MKSERLFRILGLVDEDLIEESAAPVRRTHAFRQAAAVACLALLCILAIGRTVQFSGDKKTSVKAEEPTGEAPAEGMSGGNSSNTLTDNEPISGFGTAFMSYAGPVFPLTLSEETNGITAERKTTWDFTPSGDQSGAVHQWGAAISDSYLLTNTTSGDILAMASYPYAGSFTDFAEHLPSVTVNGTEAAVTLYAGDYTGGFTDAGVSDGGSWNLKSASGWTDFQTLLEDGSYFRNAFEESPDFPETVTLYTFTDLRAPDSFNAATQAITFTIDPDKTTILTFNFNGLSTKDNGWRQYDFFVPSAIRHNRVPFLLVLGEDLDGYTLQGYENGACKATEVLPGVSCTVTRTELSLNDAIRQLCDAYAGEFRGSPSNPIETISPELFTDAVARLMTQHGPLAGSALKDRYREGRLDDILSETLTQERILYLTFPITIPAGASVTVETLLWKKPSFNYGCSDAEYKDLQGYDYVTTLASNLQFNNQTAALTGTEGIELHNQNFGFDPENGVKEVTLDPAQEYYYMEIRPKR